MKLLVYIMTFLYLHVVGTLDVHVVLHCTSKGKIFLGKEEYVSGAPLMEVASSSVAVGTRGFRGRVHPCLSEPPWEEGCLDE